MDGLELRYQLKEPLLRNVCPGADDNGRNYGEPFATFFLRGGERGGQLLGGVVKIAPLQLHATPTRLAFHIGAEKIIARQAVLRQPTIRVECLEVRAEVIFQSQTAPAFAEHKRLAGRTHRAAVFRY